MFFSVMQTFAQDDKNDFGNEIGIKTQQNENAKQKNVHQYGKPNMQNGWVSGDDFHVLLDPDSKTYGIRFSGEAKDWIHFASGLNYTFGDYSSFVYYLGIGPGGRYEFNPFLFFVNVYPYLGYSSHDKFDEKTGKKSSETKSEFTYGAMGTVGIGFKLFETSKGKKWYLTGGYTITASKFKTQGMFDNGTWLVGITVVE